MTDDLRLSPDALAVTMRPEGINATLPASWIDAKMAGSGHYFTGRPCIRGHIAKRQASNGRCVICGSEISKTRRKSDPGEAREKDKKYRLRHAERRRASYRSWYEANKEHVIETHAAWRLANPEAAKERAKRSRVKHADKVVEYSREYRRKNPEKRAALQNKRRARQFGAEGQYTVEDAARIRAAQKDKCAYCRKKLLGAGHLDHIKAISKGGTNWPNNLQWLCATCNISKHNRDPIEFAQSRGKLL